MAEQPSMRVLFRFSLGLPYRQASAEEKKLAHDLMEQLFRQWKAAGVRMVGTFGSHSAVEGFAHLVILDVDDLNWVADMDLPIINGEVGKYIEKFTFHVGWQRADIEDIWNSEEN